MNLVAGIIETVLVVPARMGLYSGSRNNRNCVIVLVWMANRSESVVLGAGTIATSIYITILGHWN